MRKRKVSTLILLAIATFIIYFVSHCSYYSNVENAYPAIYEAYEVCKENAEKLYALMLAHDKNGDLEEDSYVDTVFSPWPEDTVEVRFALEKDIVSVGGERVVSSIGFTKTDNGAWHVSIYVGNLYSHNTYLYYSPCDELPYYYCERLDGMEPNWYYSARMYY